MRFSTIQSIEDRMAEIATAYQKLLSRSGQQGYDQELIAVLRKDLNWLLEKKQKLMREKEDKEQEIQISYSEQVSPPG